MIATRDAQAVLAQEYLTTRSRILDVAAALDRIDRAPETPTHPPDPRLGVLRQAVAALAEPGPGRVETLLHLFSLPYDPAWRGSNPEREG